MESVTLLTVGIGNDDRQAVDQERLGHQRSAPIVGLDRVPQLHPVPPLRVGQQLPDRDRVAVAVFEHVVRPEGLHGVERVVRKVVAPGPLLILGPDRTGFPRPGPLRPVPQGVGLPAQRLGIQSQQRRQIGTVQQPRGNEGRRRLPANTIPQHRRSDKIQPVRLPRGGIDQSAG